MSGAVTDALRHRIASTPPAHGWSRPTWTVELLRRELAVLIGDIGQSHEGRLVGAGGVGSVVVGVAPPAFECATALGL